jgi:tRNA A37 N6-isopentenylltransferase MiaA
LQGKLSKEKMIEELNTAIWHYAKRQKTWFKRDPNIIWIDPRKKLEKNNVFKIAKNFIKK